MNCVSSLTFACAAFLGTACANQHEPERALAPAGLGSPVIQEGIVYTPVSIDSQGCLLYSIRIPGGQAPAALVYQNMEGQFSFGRPDRCVKKAGAL